MDQYPFEFKIEIPGCMVDDYIEMLKNAGYDYWADEINKQFEDQLKEM